MVVPTAEKLVAWKVALMGDELEARTVDLWAEWMVLKLVAVRAERKAEQKAVQKAEKTVASLVVSMAD